MAQYVADFQGYIADVPHFWFKRCDGKVFYFDELTAATVTPNIQYNEVNAGWSLYPVAYLPGQSTFEMQITSGKFQADLFSMTNATDFADNATYDMPAAEHLTPDANFKVVLANVPVSGSVYIKGLQMVASATTLTSGKWKFDSTDATGKTIVFYGGDSTASPAIPADIPAGTQVEILYRYSTSAKEAKIDNKSSAVGEAILVYPVYASGDECAVESSIIGNVIMKVYRCRVTSQPGLDGSYKQASTYQFTLSTMDPKRDDGNAYSIAYIKNV